MQAQQGIIVTKLFPPVARTGLILRQRLGDLLAPKGLPKLVLVTAAAGYGKTTLMAQWFEGLRAENFRCAWLSLDQADSDPADFLRYLISTLRTEIPALGEESLQEEMKVLRAGVACVHDDIDALADLASGPMEVSLIRRFHAGAMYNMLGYALLVKGDFKPARDALTKARRLQEQADSSFGVAYSSIFSGMLNLVQGKMHNAAADFRQSEDVSILDSEERSAGAAVARLLQGVVLYEWNRIEEAENLINANIELVEECAIAEALVTGFVTLAKIYAVRGSLNEAKACYSKIREMCQRRNQKRLVLVI